MSAAAGTRDELARLIASLERAGLAGADVVLVLGSGLGAFAERLREAREVPFTELDGMPRSGVPGHAGRFAVGRLGAARVVIQQGRVHLYEGRSPAEVTRSLRALVALGARAVILTNAAGGLRDDWPPGTLVRLVDHANLQGRPPLLPRERGAGCPYDPEVGEAIDAAARERGLELARGVYFGLLGPAYETPAEIRWLRAAGADLVGMSTVAEAAAAAAAGARVGAVSLVTNFAAGVSPTPPSHEEVLAAGRAAAGRFGDLLEAAAARVAALEPPARRP